MGKGNFYKYAGILFFVIIICIVYFGSLNSAYNSETAYQEKVIFKIPYGHKEGEVSFRSNGPYYDVPVTFAVDDAGNIYIGDSGNYRILKFDKDGKYLTAVGEKGKGSGELGHYFPDMDIDSAGNVYVLDSFNDRIVKFDDKGAFKNSFTSRGVDKKARSKMYNMKATKSGRIYVSDKKEGSQLYDMNGNYIQKVQGDSIEDRGGNIYQISHPNKIGDKYEIKMEKFVQPSGTLTIQSKQSAKSLSISSNDSQYPPQKYIGFDDANNLYVLYAKKKTDRFEKPIARYYFIKKYDPNGVFVQNVDLSPLMTLNGGGRRFLVTGDGSIYQMNQLLDGIEIIKYSKQ